MFRYSADDQDDMGSPPNTKWNAVSSLTRFMTDPKLGVTTLNPIETINRRKNEIEFLPAFKIATTNRT
jgi:hypothetical protein